ncbi:hypothetical protein [Nonomuraea sp. NPDC049480]|uniref:hypothetical protein n=1 Tax=Nonomuraea sp. NPDC049480 TaxID=3364353 RepID=UPI0037A5616A
MWYPQPPPHGYGYGFQPQPPPPPPKAGNLEMFLLLVIGLPVMLLAAGSAVFFVLTDRGTVSVADALESGDTGEVPTVRIETGTTPPA